MTSPAEAPPPLLVEEALVQATHYRLGIGSFESGGPGLRYPARLGSLAVDRLLFDSDYDAYRITEGVKSDFRTSYEGDDPGVAEAAHEVRQRSMAWLDWLSQTTGLRVHHSTYIDLATTAAHHGDAATIRQIIEDPKRLWLDNRYAGIPFSDPTFGQLNRVTTDSMSGMMPDVARLMSIAPDDSAEQVRTAVMPTVRSVVTEFVSRDLIQKGNSIVRTCNELLATGAPEAIEQADRLVAAMPNTSARVDVLVSLAERDKRYAAAAAEAVSWHNEKAGLAQQILAAYMKPHSNGRMSINYSHTWGGRPDAIASEPIAAAIVDAVPVGGSGTSAIETSVAFVHDSMLGGSVHGDILTCIRRSTGDPLIELTDPQFGFAARFENGEDSYAHGQVTVVDASLPEGRMVIDLSSEIFRSSIAYDEVRFLCRIIQMQKNRRASATQE